MDGRSLLINLAMARAAAETAADADSWLDYAAVAIATLSLVVSLILGLRRRGTAKRALALSEAQDARRRPRMGVYVNDSASYQMDRTRERLLVFHLLVSNPSDSPTSLVAAELHVTYAVNGVMTTVKVPHSRSPDMPQDVSPIDLPVALGAHDAKSGWFVFPIADDLTGGRGVDRLDVVVRDMHDVSEAVQVTVLREAPNAEAP